MMRLSVIISHLSALFTRNANITLCGTIYARGKCAMASYEIDDILRRHFISPKCHNDGRGRLTGRHCVRRWCMSVMPLIYCASFVAEARPW